MSPVSSWSRLFFALNGEQNFFRKTVASSKEIFSWLLLGVELQADKAIKRMMLKAALKFIMSLYYHGSTEAGARLNDSVESTPSCLILTRVA